MREHGSEGSVELFVPFSDAAVVFESGEEILDAVTLAVEMLVKCRFCGNFWQPIQGRMFSTWRIHRLSWFWLLRKLTIVQLAHVEPPGMIADSKVVQI